jgi:hypothetical protein
MLDIMYVTISISTGLYPNLDLRTANKLRLQLQLQLHIMNWSAFRWQRDNVHMNARVFCTSKHSQVRFAFRNKCFPSRTISAAARVSKLPVGWGAEGVPGIIRNIVLVMLCIPEQTLFDASSTIIKSSFIFRNKEFDWLLKRVEIQCLPGKTTSCFLLVVPKLTLF